MKYKICLTSVIWSPDYQNVRRFVSRAAQEEYFGVANLFTSDVPERNLNAGTLVNLSIFVKNGEAGIGSIMENNYAIIKELDTGKFYYYFITNATFDSVNQTRLDLQLDVFQTYYLDMTFGDAMIERAHLNRWNEAIIGHTIFDRTADDKFLVRDEIQGLPKRVKSTTECTTSPFIPNSDEAQFFENNVYGWLYAFLDAGEYEYDGVQFSTQMQYEKHEADGTRPPRFTTPYVVVCCPIMSNSQASIQLGGSALNYDKFFEFVKSNVGHIYNLKFTQFSPFNRVSRPTVTITGNTMNITACDEFLKIGTTKHIAVVQLQRLHTQFLTKEFALPQWNITKQSIVEYDDDLKANPKSFNLDYRELKIVYGGGEYSFDIQKLYDSGAKTEDRVAFQAFEIITPEIAPTFITCIPTNLYAPVYNNPRANRIGYMQENDLSIPYNKNQLDVFLANNKNFFKQKQLAYSQQRTNALINTISSIGNSIQQFGTKDFIGGAKSLGAAATAVGQTEVNIMYDQAATKLTLDNMQAGVDALFNSNSNPFFTWALNNCKILLVELEALPIDMGRALEDMHENGYTYNRMGNIKDFDSIRKKWNFVKARVEIIKTPVRLPNTVREIVKAAFERGIRFWETDDVRFNQTNLE